MTTPPPEPTNDEIALGAGELSPREILARLFDDARDWEPMEGHLWRGHMTNPPNCWRYVMLREGRYASSIATYEFVKDAIGATEYIAQVLAAKILGRA